jgi:hypothetical protein
VAPCTEEPSNYATKLGLTRMPGLTHMRADLPACRNRAPPPTCRVSSLNHLPSLRSFPTLRRQSGEPEYRSPLDVRHNLEKIFPTNLPYFECLVAVKCHG